jgi:hypothetical protein
MLYLNQGTISSSPGFTPGTAGDCFSISTLALCKYAGFNGHVASTTAASWGSSTAPGAIAVTWSFPATVTGVTGTPGVTYPFLKVSVQENVATWFMGLFGVKTQTVGASCTCGLSGSAAAPPLVILNPTLGSTLDMSGGAGLVITGGGQTSIQVNSSANGSPTSDASNNAVYCGGSGPGLINTSAAGPAGTGGNIAIVGGPTSNPSCGGGSFLSGGTTGIWKSHAAAIADPYSGVSAPTQPTAKVAEALTPVATVAQGYTPPVDATYGYINGTWVASGTDSCPSTASQQHYLTYSAAYPYNGGNIYGNCLEFTPGYYPSGINTSAAQSLGDVVLFMPGVYYLNGNLAVSNSTTVRNAWVGSQPSTQGVVFYFLSGGPLFSGNSGASSSTITAVPSYYLNCSGTTSPSGIATSLNGNVLSSQCSAGGTYVGAPSPDSYSSAGKRGLLFFLSHADSYQNTLFGGSGSLNFSGSLYFHNSSYADQVTINGAGCGASYLLGSVVLDQMIVGGSGQFQLVAPKSAATAGAVSVGLFQ